MTWSLRCPSHARNARPSAALAQRTPFLMSASAVLPFETPRRPSVTCAPHGDDAIARLAGERVELLADRALHWPRERTLFVADVHLGKSASFRAQGVPVPRGATAGDLERLTALVERTQAQRLTVLGDFLHAAAGRVPALDRSFVAWRAQHASLAITLVQGNHDRHAGDPAASWDIEVLDDPHAVAPFVLCHLPYEPPTGYALCGHVHPGVRVTAPNGSDSARLPCFVLGPRRALLPAFGRFTGLHVVEPMPGERIVAVAGSKLFPLPEA